MRIITLALLIGFSSFAIAQMPAGMQEAVDCMQSIDQQELENLGTEGEKLSNDIKALCEKGDESGASDLLLGYMKDMAENETVAQLKKCSEMMQKVMPGMPVPEMPTADMYGGEAGNICDDID